MVYIGIDPGLHGAIAAITKQGILISVEDTPILAVKKGPKTKNTYNPLQMVSILVKFSRMGQECAVALESVHAMPGQGVTGMFSMGHGLGLWEGMISALSLPIYHITPQAWKKALIGVNTGDNKEASILTAQRIIKGSSQYLTLKKHDGRAEAMLIADYLRRKL